MAKKTYKRDNMLSLNKLIERTERNFANLRKEGRAPSASAQSALIAAKGWEAVGHISNSDLDKLLTRLNTNRVMAFKNTTVEVSQLVGMRHTYTNFDAIDTGISTAPKQLAGAINEGLARIEESGYNTMAWQYLQPMALSLLHKEPGEGFTREDKNNPYFEIDTGWHGDWAELPKHITIKKLDARNKEAMQYAARLFEIPKMSEMADDIFESQAEQQRVNTFIESNTNIDSKLLGTVAIVLDQSHMWAIASKDLPYKDKSHKTITANVGTHKANYLELTRMYQEIEQTGQSRLMDEFKQMIENEDSMETITKKVDSWLTAAYKG